MAKKLSRNKIDRKYASDAVGHLVRCGKWFLHPTLDTLADVRIIDGIPVLVDVQASHGENWAIVGVADKNTDLLYPPEVLYCYARDGQIYLCGKLSRTTFEAHHANSDYEFDENSIDDIYDVWCVHDYWNDKRTKTITAA